MTQPPTPDLWRLGADLGLQSGCCVRFGVPLIITTPPSDHDSPVHDSPVHDSPVHDSPFRGYTFIGLHCFSSHADLFGSLTDSARTLFALLNGDSILLVYQELCTVDDAWYSDSSDIILGPISGVPLALDRPARPATTTA